jgi:hypothetical protein
MLAMQSAYGEPDLIGYLNLELYRSHPELSSFLPSLHFYNVIVKCQGECSCYRFIARVHPSD